MLELKDATLVVGGRQLFKGLSLMAMDGQLTCITGEAGTGKSALLWSLMGLLPLSAGFVCVDGEPLTTLSAHYYRQQMAYVPQETQTAPSADSRVSAVVQADEPAWAPVAVDRPVQLPLIEGEQALLLSDQKRIVIVDTPGASMLSELLTLAHEGRTVVVASRDDAYLNMADRVVRLGETD